MSSQFFGETFRFTQPDGSVITVRGWGDQHYAVFESMDGYTLVRDPDSGFYQYATIYDQLDELAPTGARVERFNPSALGLERSIRIGLATARSKAAERFRLMEGARRCERRRQQYRKWMQASIMADSPLPKPPSRSTVGDFMGLCMLIDFPDVPATISRSEVDGFCNRSGFDGYGNNGSVCDYFKEVSGGRFAYNNVVTEYYTAKHPKGYYTNPNVAFGTRARQLIKEALDALKASGFDFNQLSADAGNFVYALNIYYAGSCPNNWSEGLWPHSWALDVPYELPGGRKVFDYQFTDMGDELTLGTFCHENGHMICDFPDLYDYGQESNGVGTYCLMCAGNFAERNPSHVSAYLKHAAGWAKNVQSISGEKEITLTAGSNEFAIFRRNAKEYFILENRQQKGRDRSLSSAGLAIWHVDELGDNSNEQMSSVLHYELSLKQADGKFDLEKRVNQGDSGDLYFEGGISEFSDSTLPNSRWWDGTPSGLEIRNVSASGDKMSFMVKTP